MAMNYAPLRPVSAMVCAVLLTGCSADTIIWGPTGAQVITSTQELQHIAGYRCDTR